DAALLDVVAVLEVHAAHRIADLGRQRHGLVGLGGAERFDHVVYLIAANSGGRHERRLLRATARKPAGTTAPRGTPAARAAIAAVAVEVPHGSSAEGEGNHNEQRVFHLAFDPWFRRLGWSSASVRSV